MYFLPEILTLGNIIPYQIVKFDKTNLPKPFENFRRYHEYKDLQSTKKNVILHE